MLSNLYKVKIWLEQLIIVSLKAYCTEIICIRLYVTSINSSIVGRMYTVRISVKALIEDVLFECLTLAAICTQEPGDDEVADFMPEELAGEGMPLEALLQGAMLHMPHDDETLMELAIALSLQDHQAAGGPAAAQEGAAAPPPMQPQQPQHHLGLPMSQSHSSQVQS